MPKMTTEEQLKRFADDLEQSIRDGTAQPSTECHICGAGVSTGPLIPPGYESRAICLKCLDDEFQEQG